MLTYAHVCHVCSRILGVSPWTLFGVADAPSLIFSVLDPNSIASQVYPEFTCFFLVQKYKY